MEQPLSTYSWIRRATSPGGRRPASCAGTRRPAGRSSGSGTRRPSRQPLAGSSSMLIIMWYEAWHASGSRPASTRKPFTIRRRRPNSAGVGPPSVIHPSASRATRRYARASTSGLSGDGLFAIQMGHGFWTGLGSREAWSNEKNWPWWLTSSPFPQLAHDLDALLEPPDALAGVERHDLDLPARLAHALAAAGAHADAEEAAARRRPRRGSPTGRRRAADRGAGSSPGTRSRASRAASGSRSRRG